MNLAPLRYRRIFERDGGPIKKLVVGKVLLWDGTPYCEAAAYFSDELSLPAEESLRIYDDIGGCGMDPSQAVAGYKAISEALERWAFHAIWEGSDISKFGFSVDPSTTGMAAYPGLTSSGARRISNWEAVERWSLLEWWRGGLPLKIDGEYDPLSGRAEILTPFSGAAVALIWASSTRFPFRTYGFAAGRDFESACAKAAVELTRNLYGLNAYFEKGGSGSDLREMTERRLYYFSRGDGARAVDLLIASSRALSPVSKIPRKLVDAEIPGPWSRYAAVWRTLYAHEAGVDDEEALEVFSF